jgi:hypothetical protein
MGFYFFILYYSQTEMLIIVQVKFTEISNSMRMNIPKISI